MRKILAAVIFAASLFVLFVPAHARTETVYPFAQDFDDNIFYPVSGFPNDYSRACNDPVGTLIVPSIKLKQQVYSGTSDEIRTNLDRWLFSFARAGYVIGETQLCIYAHNSQTFEISAAHICEMQPGELFIFDAGDTVYLYKTESVFGEIRDSVATKYKWPTLSADKIYLVTCGRGKYRYKDVVAEGTLVKSYSKEEWESVKSTISYERTVADAVVPETSAIDAEDETKETDEETEATAPVAVRKMATDFMLDTTGDTWKASVVDENGDCVVGVELVLLDEEGFVAYSNGLPTRFVVSEDVPVWEFDKMGEGTYYLAVVTDTVPEGYEIPEDIEIVVSKKNETIHSEVEDLSMTEQKEVWWIVAISAVNVLLVGAIITIAIIKAGKRG